MKNKIGGLLQKLVTPPPIFNQFTSEIFHSVLQEIIYGIMEVFEFVWYIGFFPSQQRVGIFCFSKHLFILVMVRHVRVSICLSQFFTLCTLRHEVLMLERINKIFTIEVKILRQQYEFLCKKKDFDIL